VVVVISILVVLLGVNFRMMNWVHRSSNVSSAREFIVVDGMANCDLFHVNPVHNQYGVYLDLVYCNFPEMVGLKVLKGLFKDWIGRADVDEICAQLADVDWYVLFFDLGINDCGEKFYIIFRECFDSFVLFYYSVDSENRKPWFDKDLRNLDNITTKSHKYMKVLEKINIRTMTTVATQ
jgi:hypothetical protein